MPRLCRCVSVVLAVLLCASSACAEDTLELTTGSKLTGTIVSANSRTIKLEITVGNRTFLREYSASRVKRILVNGEPKTLQELIDAGPGAVASEGDIRKLIDEEGRKPPDWFASTPLNYPQSLDLTWPKPAPQPWDNSKNVGQYIWDRINPNPSQWRGGVKLMHHIMSTQPRNPAAVEQAMLALGTMYHNLLEDYPRSAFWFEQAGVVRNPAAHPHATLHLADSYFRLGSKSMAQDLLKKMRSYPLGAIKLLGDMGETDQALRLAEQFAAGGNAVVCYLYAGDVCRVAGDLTRAEDYYRKALQAANAGAANQSHADRDKKRAEASLAAIQFFRLSPADVRDGSYRASSLGYEDDIEVEVVVRAGKIESVAVTRHREKQFYSSIAETPRRIIARQSLVNVDTTTGATITSEAIINATAKALARGQK